MQTDDTLPVLWLRQEVFECGMLTVGVETVLDVSALPQLLAALDAHASTPDTLTQSTLVAVAPDLLKLSPEHAALYFDLFTSVRSVSPAQALQRSRLQLGARTEQEADAFEATETVPLREFLVFLFVQLYAKASRVQNTHKHATNDRWRTLEQTPSGSPMLRGAGGAGLSPTGAPQSSGERMATSSATLAMAWRASEDEIEAQVSWVKRHALLLVQLMAPMFETSVTLEQLSPLNLLLGSGSSFSEALPHFAMAAAWWRPTTGLGVDDEEIRNTAVPVSQVADWIASSLVVNHFLYPSLEQSLVEGWDRVFFAESQRAASLREAASSRASYIRPLVAPCIIENVVRRTVFRSSPAMDGAHVKLMQCRRSTVYILSSSPFASVLGCRSSTIVLGAVGRVLSVEHCDDVTVIATCARLRVNNCSNCRFFVCTNTRSILFGSNHGLVFAPYNTVYPNLIQHMQLAGVNPLLNLWNHPYNATALLKDLRAAIPNDIEPYSLLPADSFAPYAVPVVMEGSTRVNPCALPAAYMRSLQEKQAHVASVHATLHAAMREGGVAGGGSGGSTGEGGGSSGSGGGGGGGGGSSSASSGSSVRQLTGVLENHFYDWLLKSGHIHEVRDLLQVEMEQVAASMGNGSGASAGSGLGTS